MQSENRLHLFWRYMSNIFEKLLSLDIEQDDRITEADRCFCKAQEKAYHEAKEMLHKLKDVWKQISNKQADILREFEPDAYNLNKYIRFEQFSESEIDEKIELLPQKFISSLVKYFNETYQVSIDRDIIAESILPSKSERDIYGPQRLNEQTYHQRMQEILLRYTDVLNQIYIHLGDRGFTEQAIFELKSKCHKAAWNLLSGIPDYELKKDIVRLNNYACKYESWLYYDRWTLFDSTKNIIRGLAHFETGRLGYYPSDFTDLLGYDVINAPKVLLPNCTKIVHIKLFKNGRVDIKFSSDANADRFVTDYLGRVC